MYIYVYVNKRISYYIDVLSPLSLFFSLSLCLYIHIYIYMCTHTRNVGPPNADHEVTVEKHRNQILSYRYVTELNGRWLRSISKT